MTTYNLNAIHDIVRPSDVFGAEPTNAAGYARKSVNLKLTDGQEARCGTLIAVDHLTGEGTLLDAAALEVIATNPTTAFTSATESIGIFFKRDALVDPIHFEHLKASHKLDGESSKVVLIMRGDGSGQVSPSYLDASGTDFYSLSKNVQDFLQIYFEQVARFKWIKQQKRVV